MLGRRSSRGAWFLWAAVGVWSLLLGVWVSRPGLVVGLSAEEATAVRGAACKWYVRYAEGCLEGACVRPEGRLYRPRTWPWEGDVYAKELQNQQCSTAECGYYQIAVPCSTP